MQDGGKSEGPIETYPKFWNLNLLTANGQEILRIPAWKKSFELVKKGAEGDTGEGSLTREHSRVPNSQDHRYGMMVG